MSALPQPALHAPPPERLSGFSAVPDPVKPRQDAQPAAPTRRSAPASTSALPAHQAQGSSAVNRRQSASTSTTGRGGRYASAQEENDEASSSEYGTASSSADLDDATASDPDFRGSLKTCLSWNLKDKWAGVLVRQNIETSRRLELKFKGLLSAAGDGFHWAGHLKKHIFTNGVETSCLKRVYLAASQRHRGVPLDEPTLNPDGFLPAGLRSVIMNDWVVSPGMTLGGSTTSNSCGSPGSMFGPGFTPNGVKYVLGLRKAPQVVKRSGRSDLWLTGKGACMFDPQRKEVSATAGLRLKLYKYNVTSKQDLKVTLGVDAAHDGKELQQSLYFKLAENNWAVRFQCRQWLCTYEL